MGINKLAKNILVGVLTLSLFFIAAVPLLAGEELIITSHEVNIFQDMVEEKEGAFKYLIEEALTFQNQSSETYQSDLSFWVGEEAEEIVIVTTKDSGEELRLRTSGFKNGLIMADLEEEVFIQPGKSRDFKIKYQIPSSAKQGWEKTILYPHASESLEIKINPQEFLGYKAFAKGFSVKKFGGLYISPALTPRKGTNYSVELSTREEAGFEGETPSVVIAEQIRLIGKEFGWIIGSFGVIGDQIERLVLDHIILVLIINNLIVLYLASRWPPRIRLKRPKLWIAKILRRTKRLLLSPFSILSRVIKKLPFFKG